HPRRHRARRRPHLPAPAHLRRRAARRLPGPHQLVRRGRDRARRAERRRGPGARPRRAPRGRAIVTPDAILADHWFEGATLTPIARGLINETFRVGADRPYALQRVSPIFDPAI